jgi:glycosyltransferase involved in cell wall biosynthesis
MLLVILALIIMSYKNIETLCSVIIPTYNSSETILTTLESVFKQDYSPLEIIVVDDFSSDDTLEKLKNYDNITVIALNENKGVSNARNVGFQESTGGFIQFLDSDDELIVDKISKQIAQLNRTNADVSIGDWVEFSTDQGIKEIVRHNNFFDNSIGLELSCIKDFWTPLCSIIYRRKSIEKVTWNVELKIVQDARFLFDVVFDGAIVVFLQDLTGRYRRNTTNSLSSSNRMFFVDDCLRNIVDIHNMLKKKDEITKVYLDAITYVLSHLLVEYSALRNRTKHNEVLMLLNDVDNGFIHYENNLLRLIAKIIGYIRLEKILFYFRF